MVNEVRQQYYIPKLRAVVRTVIGRCQWCKIKKTLPQTPRMAPLPLARLASFTRPFSYVGLDLSGPLNVKINKSSAKRWVALFTCLTIRAVHVEIVHSLSTAALERHWKSTPITGQTSGEQMECYRSRYER